MSDATTNNAELIFEENQLTNSNQTAIPIDYDFIYTNFGSLCRFCLKMRSVDLNVKNIVSDELSDLVNKINYTLYENATEKLDYKIANSICEICVEKIDEFFEFKKQTESCYNLIIKVKNEIEGNAQIKSEVDDKFPDNSNVPNENWMNEIEELEEDMENISENNENEEAVNGNDNPSESEESDTEEELEENFGHQKEASEDKPKRKSKKLKKKLAEESTKKPKKQYSGKLHCCPICGKLCKGIQMHLLTHTGEKKYNCYLCPKSFTQSGQLKRHINSHLNIRNYSCSVCDRTFVDPSSVTKHMVIHNKEDRKYICTLCGARFNRLGALRYHEKTHRQERNHVCDICSKSFLAKYDLTKHYRIHTGEKPYKCQYCDKRFTISKNAKVHMRVHTKERPYNCSFCELSFSYRSSLKNHLIKIHNHADVPASLPLAQNTITNIAGNSVNLMENVNLNNMESASTTQIEQNLGMPSGANLLINSSGLSMIQSIDRSVQ